MHAITTVNQKIKIKLIKKYPKIPKIKIGKKINCKLSKSILNNVSIDTLGECFLTPIRMDIIISFKFRFNKYVLEEKEFKEYFKVVE